MQKCESFQQKINFYDELDETNRHKVDEHLQHCETCNRYFKQVRRLERLLKADGPISHISNGQLTRYVAHINAPHEPDFDGQKPDSEKLEQIKAHLRECDYCSARVQEMQASYRDLENFVEQTELPDLTLKPKSATYRPAPERASVLEQALSFIDSLLPARAVPKFATVAMLLLVFVLFIFNPLSIDKIINEHKNLSEIEPKTITFAVRGISDNTLERAFIDFNNQNYERASQGLNEFLKDHSEHENRLYVQYVYGLSLIMEVNRSSDMDKLMQNTLEHGIAHLKDCLQRTNNERIREDILYYLGKAYLMKQEESAAKEYFEQVISHKGKRMEEAKSILSALENR